jgi:hypothetical protein
MFSSSDVDMSDDDGSAAGSRIGSPVQKKTVGNRRRVGRETAGEVIDRVALKREESARAAEAAEKSRAAFRSNDSESDVGRMGPPSLLRRATTSSSSGSSSLFDSASDGSRNSSFAAGMDAGVGSAVKRGGKASSSVNFYQREKAKEKVVKAVEKAREVKVLKKRNQAGIEFAGLFGGSRFE